MSCLASMMNSSCGCVIQSLRYDDKPLCRTAVNSSLGKRVLAVLVMGNEFHGIPYFDLVIIISSLLSIKYFRSDAIGFKRVTWLNMRQLKLRKIFKSRLLPKHMGRIIYKHNNPHLALTICSDICYWTSSVPRKSQACSRKTASLTLGTDNVKGQISEHIFAPNRDCC